jgi:hypothetical protein
MDVLDTPNDQGLTSAAITSSKNAVDIGGVFLIETPKTLGAVYLGINLILTLCGV